MHATRVEPLLDELEVAVLDKVKREMPVKLSKNPHIIERILVQLLVFNPW